MICTATGTIPAAITSDINTDELYQEMLESHKCNASIDKKEFDSIVDIFKVNRLKV
jgi:preprotein translocase subunit SecB